MDHQNYRTDYKIRSLGLVDLAGQKKLERGELVHRLRVLALLVDPHGNDNYRRDCCVYFCISTWITNLVGADSAQSDWFDRQVDHTPPALGCPTRARPGPHPDACPGAVG